MFISPIPSSSIKKTMLHKLMPYCVRVLQQLQKQMVAGSVAFLIARYFARARIRKVVEGNKKSLAMDKAIGENRFGVVTLLRWSPLLPFSLGNYLYRFTYVLGSWLGMLPGTWAYVSAGAFGRAIIVAAQWLFFIY